MLEKQDRFAIEKADAMSDLHCASHIYDFHFDGAVEVEKAFLMCQTRLCMLCIPNSCRM